MAPRAELVAAAAVCEKPQLAGGERVELEELAAADILLHGEHVAGERLAAVDRLGLEADLLAHPHWRATRWSWAVLPKRVVISIERSRRFHPEKPALRYSI